MDKDQEIEDLKAKNASEAALRTLRQASAWIPVSEKLPVAGQYVLLANHTEADSHYESTVRAARYMPNLPSPERWAVLGRFPGTVHSAHVSHWMPLPEAPKNLAAAMAAEGGK